MCYYYQLSFVLPSTYSLEFLLKNLLKFSGPVDVLVLPWFRCIIGHRLELLAVQLIFVPVGRWRSLYNLCLLSLGFPQDIRLVWGSMVTLTNLLWWRLITDTTTYSSRNVSYGPHSSAVLSCSVFFQSCSRPSEHTKMCLRGWVQNSNCFSKLISC